jgi:hypothetical protein
VGRSARRRDVKGALGKIVLALASVGLFLLSRGKWSDAIIDSGREWIVPDALARGDLLYRDVVYWFGPFTPYFHAAFFKLFGSSFRTLVVAGIVGSIGVLAALYFALRRVTGRREAALWTALAIPALVFMPNAGGPILGMGYRIWHAAAFSLAAITLASSPASVRKTLRAAAAGALCGAASLCRTEWGLVALASVLLATWLEGRAPGEFARSAAAAVATFLGVFGATVGVFVAAAGWKAVVEDGHVFLTGLPPETREFLVAYSGIRDWPSGVAEMLYSAAMWGGALVLLHVLAIGRSDRGRLVRKLPLVLAFLVLLGLTAALGGAGGAVLLSGAPLVSAAAAVLAVTPGTARRPALAAFGVAGVLLSYRRPFHIGDAAYVGPPVLFALVSAAGIVKWLIDRERDDGARERLRAWSIAGVLSLVVLAFAGRALHYAEDDRIAVPGTEGMLVSRPERVLRLASIGRAVAEETRTGEGLVVFPEGELLNHMTRRPNPIRHKLYIPGYLTDRNEDELLVELEKAPPAAVVVLYRPTGEYGRADFGDGYGRKIGKWVDENYAMRPVTVDPRSNPRTSPRLGTRRK